MAQQQLTDEQKLEQQYKTVKKRQEEGGSFSQSLGEGRLPLQKGVFVPLRFVGMPEEVFYSFIIGDDGKYKYFTFPEKEKDPNFILFRIIDKVLERDYMGKDKNGDAMFNYHHQESHPEIFNMVYNNGLKEIGKYGPNGWANPSGYVNRAMLANVINRAPFTLTIKNEQGQDITKSYDENHCQTIGKTLLLAKDNKSSTAPITIYEDLLTNIFPVKGTFWKFDVAIKRLNGKPWYTVITSSDIKEGIKNNAPEMVALSKYIKDGEYPEEQKYQRYNLLEMASPATYKYIHDSLKVKISQIDDSFGTKFLAEIEDSLSTSKSAPKNQPMKEEALKKDKEVKKEETVNESIPEEKPVTKSRKSVATSHSVTIESVAPFYKDLVEEEKSLITGVVDGKISYSAEAGDLLPCPNVKCSGPKEGQPENIATMCIYCGQKFQ